MGICKSIEQDTTKATEVLKATEGAPATFNPDPLEIGSLWSVPDGAGYIGARIEGVNLNTYEIVLALNGAETDDEPFQEIGRRTYAIHNWFSLIIEGQAEKVWS